MEKKNAFRVLGLMSGTSLDGLDMSYAIYNRDSDKWTYNLEEAVFIPYGEDMVSKLRHAIYNSAEQLLQLHVDYGKWIGKQCYQLIKEKQWEVDFISTHGHTVFHQPEKGITFQAGSLQHIFNAVKIPVVGDFRTIDVAKGGQGAPFAPIGDKVLFSEYDICVNLGGISNLSYDKEGNRIAYDVGPCNMILSYILKDSNLEYDDKGTIARKGNMINGFYDELNKLSYFSAPYPKSTGYEWFQSQVAPIVDKYYSCSLEDLLHTGVQHISFQLSQAFAKAKKDGMVLLTGGGAKNDFLVETIRSLSNTNLNIVVPKVDIVDFKEALIFGLMGAMRWVGDNNVISSVTGASSDSCSGVIVN